IVGAIVRDRDRIMLCRRAIRPRYGFWTLPGGFMEIGESLEAGAAREVHEEAGATVSCETLFGIYTVPRLGQVHVFFLADIGDSSFAPGSESIEVEFFAATDEAIPWDDLAFPVNRWVLRDYLSLEGRSPTVPFRERPNDLNDRMSPVDFHPLFPPPGKG
ncbi:MAG: NUDIX domain-containing protein, partial [Planctomycetaceae bacterium]|nr:NUDIX domain-containing protein [Planctomycetaceae bacterium]